MEEKDHKTRIHIDGERYDSPNPTTRDALYALGDVKQGLDLYREVRGDREDPIVRKGPEEIHLKEDEHFHSGKPPVVTIFVESTPHEWTKHRITYAEVVTLFDPEYPKHPDIIYSVKYTKGPSYKPDGTLSPGGSVQVKNKMEFRVKSTGQS